MHKKLFEYASLKGYRNNILLITCVVFLTLITYAYHSPLFLLYVGEKTFGGTPPVFYNISIAEKAYTRASELKINDKPTPWAHYQLGRIAFIKGDLPLALTYFKKELEYYPNHTKVYYMEGLTFGYMGREREGIKAFTWYTQNTNDSWASFNDLAWLQFRVGDIEEALETIEPIAKNQPYNPWVANTYAVLLMNTGRHQEAKASLQRGLITLDTMTEEDWGIAYPGNDPRIYNKGLTSMRESFESNQQLVDEKLRTQAPATR